MSEGPITITCEESAHLGKAATVARFTLRVTVSDDGTTSVPRWSTTGYRHRSSPTWAPSAKEGNARIDRLGTTGRRLTLRDDPLEVDHEKVSLRCPLCGFDVQARKVRMDAVLDTLRAAGVAAISLRALGARLR